MSTMSAPSQRLKATAVTGYLLSLALLSTWSVIGQSSYSVAFQYGLLIPLLFPAVGLLKGKPYTHAWSGFVASLYLLSSATSWWVYPQERIIASATIVVLLIWIVASTYFARSRGRELGLGLKKLKS
ncbi:DUF2069 domain-containing protein [Ferrimonas lipolytica]|uniref:DUF2069 domain-containing protein n=1 Tax=Ferrimonas lipolytica TaxID=2724191 RepID=A0A6H1UCV3_9GAMM|nr:DUF2069 domain-containing protein [Ferrimonas lipolytica]QIZ76915.1 DUF2069 domain-containing protein [Ferrimonas lipolytica]